MNDSNNDPLIDDLRSSLHQQADAVHPKVEPFDPNRAAALQLGSDLEADERAARGARGRLLVAVAAGAVLLLISAGVVVARGGSDETGVATVPSPTVEDPSSSPTVTTVVDTTTSTIDAGVETTVTTEQVLEPPTGPMGEQMDPDEYEGDVVPPGDDGVTPPVDPTAVHTRLELDTTTVAAGGRIDGRVVVVNETGAPIVIYACTVFLTGIQNDTIDLVPRFECPVDGPDGDMRNRIVFPQGESTWPVQLDASYLGCATYQQDATPNHPLCTGDSGREVPPLPAGRYRTLVREVQGLPTPSSIDILVT